MTGPFTRRSLLLTALAAPAVVRAERSFSKMLWDDISDTYAAILEHPFLGGLTDGTLAIERFRYYLIQDAHYLRAFSRASSLLAAKAPRQDWALTLNQHSLDTIEVERALHQTVLAEYGVTDERMVATEIAPSAYAYINHFLLAAQGGTFAEGLAAVLPCYWIYQEVGRELVKKGSPKPAYQQWIDQYAGDEYAAAVSQVLAMMDGQAPSIGTDERERCRQLFQKSARYEWMFWDMAWRLERWRP